MIWNKKLGVSILAQSSGPFTQLHSKTQYRHSHSLGLYLDLFKRKYDAFKEPANAVCLFQSSPRPDKVSDSQVIISVLRLSPTLTP